jgi:hypothetical protein
MNTTDTIQSTFKVAVPKGTGRRGFLLAVEQVLKLQNVVSVVLDVTGMSYTVAHPPELELTQVSVDFSLVSPYSVVRSRKVVEYLVGPNTPLMEFTNAVATLAKMKLRVGGLVVSPESDFFDWLNSSLDDPYHVTEDICLGYTVYTDQQIPNDTFILLGCTNLDELHESLVCSCKVTIPKE